MQRNQENLRILLEITDTNIRWCKDMQWRTAFYVFSLHAGAYIALSAKSVPTEVIASVFVLFAIVDAFAISVLVELHFSISKYRYREWCIARSLLLDMHFTGMSTLTSAGRSPFLIPLSLTYLSATIALCVFVGSGTSSSHHLYFTLMGPLVSLVWGLYWYVRQLSKYRDSVVAYGQRILQYPEILKKDAPDISNFDEVKDKLLLP
jgi:hypothetical protein